MARRERAGPEFAAMAQPRERELASRTSSVGGEGDVIPLLRGSAVRLVRRGHWLVIEITGPGNRVRRMRVTLDELAAIAQLASWRPWSGLAPTEMGGVA